MQSLQWYKNRLAAMSVPEVAWRIRNKVRDSVDRCAWRAHRPLPALSRIVRSNGHPATAAGDARIVGDLPLTGQASERFESSWHARCLDEADDILAGRLRLFGRTIETGGRVNWNYEYNARRETPCGFAGSIDYRDHREAGDCKWAWEPSRHQHLMVLARAYRLTGDSRYAAAVLEHIESWIDQCPVGMGMQWRSPLELAIRLINWAWALAYIEPAGLLRGAAAERVLAVAYEHLRDVSRKYSRFSSANNHTVGEASGVYIGSAFWPQLIDAPAWRAEAKRILIEEMDRQVLPDGVHAELAVGYHLFVLQFFTLPAVIGRRMGDEFPQKYWNRLERMYEFVAALLEGGAPPLFNDCDDGYVLNLGRGAGAFEDWLGVGAMLFGRDDFATAPSEAAFWLLGEGGVTRTPAPEKLAASDRLRSHGFSDAGIYVLQSGRRGAADRISVTLDCGELGFGSIAAHGHADALSITLRVGGLDILVDPGTYDYFTHRRWRDYFRGTRAHNTIVVNDRDQSVPLGLFNWGARAASRCLAFESNADTCVVEGEHDGYRERDGIVHRRRVELEGRAGRIEIHDHLTGGNVFGLAQFLHFSEQCEVTRADGDNFIIQRSGARIFLECDPRLETTLVNGDEAMPCGWVSRQYHQRNASPTLIGTARCTGDTIIKTVLRVESYPS